MTERAALWEPLATPITNGRKWAGRITSALPVALMAWSGAIKLMNLVPVQESFTKLGYPTRAALIVGILELSCVALYVIPRTAVLGAIVLTGFLGGAVASHYRVGDPLFSHTLFPVYAGMLAWVGLYLRDARLQALTQTEKER